MGVINASALTALQTRINAERSRRGLGSVTFTGGVGSGQVIQAAHFNELRNATEGLNTLGSQTFNWTGTIATGASITDVLPQIDNFVTTLEDEVLASWKPLQLAGNFASSTNQHIRRFWHIPSTITSPSSIRFKATTGIIGSPAFVNTFMLYSEGLPSASANLASTNGMFSTPGFYQAGNAANSRDYDLANHVLGGMQGIKRLPLGYNWNLEPCVGSNEARYTLASNGGNTPRIPNEQTPNTGMGYTNKVFGRTTNPFTSPQCFNTSSGQIMSMNGTEAYGINSNTWYSPEFIYSYPYVGLFAEYYGEHQREVDTFQIEGYY